VNSHQNPKLNPIEIASIFNCAFRDEYRNFENNIRNMASGTNAEDVWQKWLGINLVKQFKYRNAKLFVNNELFPATVNELRDVMFRQLYPIIKNISAELIRTIVKAELESLSALLVEKKKVTFDQLLQIDFRALLITSIHTKTIMEINDLLKDAMKNPPMHIDDSSEEEDCLSRHSFGALPAPAVQPKYKVTQWAVAVQTDKEYQNEIKREFNSGAVRIAKS
jgi:hypothetical protein